MQNGHFYAVCLFDVLHNMNDVYFCYWLICYQGIGWVRIIIGGICVIDEVMYIIQGLMHVLDIGIMGQSNSIDIQIGKQYKMSFKKKPQPGSQIHDAAQKLNMLLGLGCSQVLSSASQQPTLSRQLILSSAMFWDSKKRIDKIKSLILKDIGLQQFNDTKDFQIQQLISIQLLSLSKNKITHLHPLSNLDTLLCLNINHNKVYDITPLHTLHKLQQLYASNNQISHIDALKSLGKLRIVNLYANKIGRLQECLAVLERLGNLQEIDVEENPVYQVGVRGRFIGLGKLVRFNGELILEEQRQQLGVPNSSVVMLPNAKFRDTHTSFLNSNKSKLTATTTPTTTPYKSKSQLQQNIHILQQQYLQIDDKFEQQIVKNVQLKSQLSKMLEQKKLLQRKHNQIKDKEQMIGQLKRKVKMLKQNLFNGQNGDRKGELLRELFQLEMTGQATKQKGKKQTQVISNKNTVWVRKFDYDQQIVVGGQNDDKYLLDEDQQLALLLSQNNSALQQIKEELRQMNL